jgi:hypothetical protein
MFHRKQIPPLTLNDQEKVEYLAQMKIGDTYPSAFALDVQQTLIHLLARRIVELEHGA